MEGNQGQGCKSGTRPYPPQPPKKGQLVAVAFREGLYMWTIGVEAFTSLYGNRRRNSSNRTACLEVEFPSRDLGGERIQAENMESLSWTIDQGRTGALGKALTEIWVNFWIRKEGTALGPSAYNRGVEDSNKRPAPAHANIINDVGDSSQMSIDALQGPQATRSLWNLGETVPMAISERKAKLKRLLGEDAIQERTSSSSRVTMTNIIVNGNFTTGTANKKKLRTNNVAGDVDKCIGKLDENRVQAIIKWEAAVAKEEATNKFRHGITSELNTKCGFSRNARPKKSGSKNPQER
ncbi:hypothetical protein Bbelb_050400 [Branchiostoma belcheri]|nr:hypothetical protein Bbelb_050400 [Branchiostoma belcheri]